MNVKLDGIKFDERGLIPAIVQDARSGEVLTLAYMNAESLTRTLEEGETWFWSRSRSALWHKGETSGNTQRVVELLLDCDADALVVRVEPRGPACHTGARSCFFEKLAIAHEAESPQETEAVLSKLYSVIAERQRERPQNSYTTYLFEKGLDKILKKVGEESAETIIAAKNEDAEPLVAEISDLIYHLLVLMVARGISLEAVSAELARRTVRRGGE